MIFFPFIYYPTSDYRENIRKSLEAFTKSLDLDNDFIPSLLGKELRFKCEIFQAKVKNVIIDSLSFLVNEVNLEATSNGLSLQAMDSAHVSLVSLNMKEEGFEEYRCDKNTTLGLNLLDFGKVLKLAKPNDVMTILANEDNSFLTIKFDNESK